ncbi:uncharacterized protein JCM15063_003140 [Sporobolomyces koalae]|uniref:uncharacterized protein n=1 Tax=Sporobolomyces koalae TaxID=500713 RepID=UPI003177C717
MSASEEHRPTLEQHEARQRRAEAIPLEIGTELAWSGSSLEPGSHPPSDYPHGRSISPSPLRPLESRLLDPIEGVAAQPWRLELVEPLPAGTYRYSQVWRAVAVPRDENNRLHEFDIAHALCDLDQFVLLQSSADRSARSWTLVGLRFSRTLPKPEDDEVDEEAMRNGTSDDVWWNEWDQDRLMGSARDVFDPFDDVFDDLAGGWYKFEKKRRLLDFLYMHQRLSRAQQQQPQRSEEAREEQLKLDARLKCLFEQYGAGH